MFLRLCLVISGQSIKCRLEPWVGCCVQGISYLKRSCGAVGKSSRIQTRGLVVWFPVWTDDKKSHRHLAAEKVRHWVMITGTVSLRLLIKVWRGWVMHQSLIGLHFKLICFQCTSKKWFTYCLQTHCQQTENKYVGMLNWFQFLITPFVWWPFC